MPYTKQDLITLYSLNEDEVNQTLTAAGLCVDSESYTDEQIQTGFELIRSYFSDGQVSDYTVATELFKSFVAAKHSEEESLVETKQLVRDKNKANVEEFNAQQSNHLNVLDLIALATKHCFVKVELVEAIQIMPNCGLLPNQSQFAPDECDRFVQACNLIKKQNKSYEEVAAHFGIGKDHTLSDRHEGDIETSVDEVATNLDLSSNGIVSEMMRSKAKADASAASSMYFKHLADEFASPEFHAAWHQVESVLKAKVVGKSQLRARQVLGEIRAIPPSHSPSNVLPEATDNGSTSD